MYRFYCLYALFILLRVFPAQAAPLMPDSLRVGLVICYPGSDIYELEGHAALHLQGTIDGGDVDVAVNYGLFDFNAPNFVYRFVKGETDYWCGASDWDRSLYMYARDGRRVVEYPIPLDSLQTARLVALVQENLLPQNRVYRYNYVKDNCSTRPLRILELALADSIIVPQPQGPVAADSTFRQVMRQYHANYPWYQFGIDLALGSGIDYPITAREKTFAPIVLDSQLAAATVGGRNLTSDVIVVNEGHDVVLGPTPWYATPMAVGWALFALLAGVTVRDLRRRRVTRWVDAVLFGVYGLAGLLLTFLIFVSVHEATSPNWLYLWLNPLCLTVTLLIWLKKRKNMVISYQFINFALILAMIAIWPWTGQSMNAAFIPFIGCDLMRSASYIIIQKRLI